MRKLAIVCLLVMVGCKRQASVTTAPSQPAGTTANPNVSGGSSHRDALNRFLNAAKVQDIQAMSNVWGTAKGPARTDRTNMSVQVMEERIIIMMRCLRHDSYAIKAETPGTAGERVFNVEIKLRSTIALADFTTTPGPENRFYVRTLDLEKLNPICGAR